MRNDDRTSWLAAMMCGLLALANVASGNARQPAGAPQDEQKNERAGPLVERDEAGRVRVKLVSGGGVAVDNRSTGRITVIGWDKDYVEAVATSERGQEYVRSHVRTDSSGAVRIWLKADYASLGDVARLKEKESEKQTSQQPQTPNATATPSPGAQPTPSATPAKIHNSPDLLSLFSRMTLKENDPPLSSDDQPVRIHIEVHVPRYAELEPIRVWRSPVEIKGIEKGVAIQGNRSNIVLDNVGAADVRNGSGLVEISNTGGLVSVMTASGPIRISNASGDVRALSISGTIEIKCARGHVAVSNTEGPITLVGLSGNVVDANSTNSNVYFTGPIRDDGLYLLKSMAGNVEMRTTPGEGFTATLSSYRGGIETDYTLKTNQAQHSPTPNRIIGRFGNGRAQITLDSFDGAVKLKKAGPDEITDCK